MSLPTCPTCFYAKGVCKKTGVEIRRSTGCTFHTPKPMTNYDRLISKTPEEMAKFMSNGECPPPVDVPSSCPHYEDGISCVSCWLEWLKSPVNLEAGK